MASRDRSEDELLSWGELAARFGVETVTVQGWHKKSGDFPEPAGRLRNQPLRRFGDVLDWLERRAAFFDAKGHGAWAAYYRGLAERYRRR